MLFFINANNSSNALTIKQKTTQFDKFSNEVAQVCYTHNAFPTYDQAVLLTEEIVLQIKNREPDDQVEIDANLPDKVL